MSGEGDQPYELAIAEKVHEYGAQSVYGRVMSANEIFRLDISKRIVSAYFARENAEDVVNWVRDNKQDADLLSLAHKLVEDGREYC